MTQTTPAPATVPGLIRRFFSYYKPHRRLFYLDFSCAVLSGLLELGFAVAVKVFIDRLLPNQNWQLIALAALGLFIIYLVNAGCRQAGPKILSDLFCEGGRLLQESTSLERVLRVKSASSRPFLRCP